MQYELTNRENQIFRLISAGFSAKEIADHIYCSSKTVEKTIDNIKKKTGMQKNTELVSLYFCGLMNLSFDNFRKIMSEHLLGHVEYERVAKTHMLV